MGRGRVRDLVFHFLPKSETSWARLTGTLGLEWGSELSGELHPRVETRICILASSLVVL